jgi:hypothetical protein
MEYYKFHATLHGAEIKDKTEPAPLSEERIAKLKLATQDGLRVVQNGKR